jgi:diguanylate cyclase (GGDEF)-like protein
VSLRVRLSAAFFVLLLGPLAAGVAALVGEQPTTYRDPQPQASLAVRGVIAAKCRHLRVVAQALAVVAAAQDLPYLVSDGAPDGPWAVCGADPATLDGPVSEVYAGLAARAEIRGSLGEVAGYAFAVLPVDSAFLAELSAAAGARVVPVATGAAGSVLLFTYDDQPLPLALVAPPPRAERTPIIVTAALAAGLVAVLLAAMLAWWLGWLATRPLRQLVGTVGLVAAGDLSVRSRLSGRDETGRLAAGLDELIAGMQETQRLSVTDALTGLGNLRHLTDSLRLEIERATRFNRALGILVIDLDHFKGVNDRYGHRAGDAVLVEFARRVRRAIREVDLAFRQGGEEFVILLPETDVPGSLTAARRVNEAVRDIEFPFLSSGDLSSGDLSSGFLSSGEIRGAGADGGSGRVQAWIPVTVSIGVAVFPRHALTGAELLDAADHALYSAKAAGRDTFVLAGAPIPEQWAPVPTRTVIESGGGSGGTPSP